MPNAREALSVHCCRFCSYKVGNRIIHDDLVVGGGAKTLPHTAHEEAKKIVAEPFPQQEELDSKEERLKVLTDELNQAAIE